MEESAPKRRKTSPTTSVPVTESNEPASSDSATRRSSRLSLNRPSFASPTKASLARSNPEILQRRSPSRGKRPDEEPPAPAASEPDDSTSRRGSLSELASAQLEEESQIQQSQGAEGGGDGATVEQPKSPVRTAVGGLSMRPKRTPTKPSPRPLPPPSAEEEELIDPFKGRRLRRSPPPGVLPAVEPEEPELPPTPTQKGLADPSTIVTEPAGIHNSPSKRPRRSRVLAAKMNSSPLKPSPLRPLVFTEDNGGEPALLRLARESLRNEPRRRRGKRKSHPGRQIEEADPLADKRALRDSLLAEVARLEADLEVVFRENERIYEMQVSRRHNTDLPGPEEQGRILDVLSRHALPPEKEPPPDPMRNWLDIAVNPIAFLPFGGADTASLLPPLVIPAAENTAAEVASPPLASHHPIPMTAEEELPYLQAFTPLTFTSSMATMEPEAREDREPLLQRHAISVASSPPGLFLANIDMTVDTKTLAISDLGVPRLDPAAVTELGPFLEKILQGKGNNSALTRNVSVISWAMAEWVRFATRRACFWYGLEQELGSAEGIVQCAGRMMRASTKRKPRGRPRGEESGDEDDDNRLNHESDRKAHPSKADVLARMGRTSLDLDLSSVAGEGDDGDGDDRNHGVLVARIQWRLEFDWTGEARSRIGLLLCAPAKWRASDDKGSLAGLSDMFDKLLRDGREPLEAVKIVVALVVGDGSS
ncbi:hypothetical protein F4678DRAFT_438851 [Xylaria arbuscula]|nr:hypothetical protein F4678DRAFT_438851 [Xylaria arbuscula]